MIQQILQMIGVIANDSFNDSIYIGNDNYDNISQAMVIGLQVHIKN